MASFIIGTIIMSLSISAVVGVVLFITRRMNAPGCVHQWAVVTRLYKKPVEMAMPSSKSGLDVDSWLKVTEKIDELRHGSTLVLLTCEKCGLVRERIYVGITNAPEVSP